MLDAGVNLLFLSGNAVCWVTPFRASSDGRPNRIVTRAGPYGGWADAGRGDDQGLPVHRPRRGAADGPRGTSRRSTAAATGSSTQPEHWIFEGTGMKKGDRIRGLVGWEYHG